MGTEKGGSRQGTPSTTGALTSEPTGERSSTRKETNVAVTDITIDLPTDPDLAEPSGSATGALTPLLPGTRVEVRSSFDRKWGAGFEVIEAVGTTYRLRRTSDGATLPGTFERDTIRRQRRGGQWWY